MEYKRVSWVGMPVFWSASSLFKAKCEKAMLPSVGCIVSLGQENKGQHLSLISTRGCSFLVCIWKGWVCEPVFFSPWVVLASFDEHCHYLSLCFSFISASLAASHHTMSHFMAPQTLYPCPHPHCSLLIIFLYRYENPSILWAIEKQIS